VKELAVVSFKSETFSCSDVINKDAGGRGVAEAEEEANTLRSKSTILARNSLSLSSALFAT
jgi:hypothetical protein